MSVPSVISICAVIGTAGHIDHGKTSLVAALTGIDTDTLKDEKRRGISIDLGFAHMDVESNGGKARAAFVDVPGHERFIRNMLAGVTGMDMVVFAVAVDDGIRPQTLEHLDIVRFLGIKNAVFAMTKCDLADEERKAEVEKEIGRLIKDTALGGSPIIRVSTVTGQGVAGLKALIKERIANRRSDKDGLFRLPIDRSFSVHGFGAVVTGTVASGSIKKGDEAVLFPGGAKVRVRGIQSLHLDADEARAGQRAALNISGISHRDVERGFMLVSSGPFQGLIRFARAKGPFAIDAFFEFVPDYVLKPNAALKLHHLTMDSPCRVRLANNGQGRFGRLFLKKPLLMLCNDRFILRDASRNRTIGGGAVFLPYLSRQVMPKLDPLSARVAPAMEPFDRLNLILTEKTPAIDKNEASFMLGVREDAVHGAAGFCIIDKYVASAKTVAALEKDMIAGIEAFHRQMPMEKGMREDALRRLFKGAPPALPKAVVDRAVSMGRLKREGPFIMLLSHRAEASGIDAAIEKAIMSLFAKPFSSIGVEELKKLPFKAEDARRVFTHLQGSGAVVRLKQDSFVSGAALGAAKARLVEHIRLKGDIKASEMRDILGIGRRLAIEMLEYFDRERVTLRKGDVRTLWG